MKNLLSSKKLTRENLKGIQGGSIYTCCNAVGLGYGCYSGRVYCIREINENP